MMDTIFVAWNSAMDDDVISSFDIEKVKSHIDSLHTNWTNKWSVDEDGQWQRDFDNGGGSEYVLITPLQFLE